MPLYKWACDDCKKAVEVIRTFDDYQVPPTDEEVALCLPDQTHNWKRVIDAPKMVRGPSWNGKKGSW